MGLAVVGSGAGGLASTMDPEEVERVSVGKLVGSELQQGFAAGFGPEFFAPFHTLVDLFDGGFDGTERDRQAGLAVRRVVGQWETRFKRKLADVVSTVASDDQVLFGGSR